jgi:hypothetical protein
MRQSSDYPGRPHFSAISMTQPTSDIHPSSGHVLARSFLRMGILVAFAMLSSHGFGKALASVLPLASMFCVVIAAMHREAMLGPVLTHWDEAAAYALASGLASRLA